MSEESQQQPAETGASEQQPAAVETIVGMPASDLVSLGTTGDVIAAPVLETLTGGTGADLADTSALAHELVGVDLGEGDRSVELVVALTDNPVLKTAHDAIEALLACAARLRVLDRLEPDTHAKATGALADLKARLGL